jgi:4-carboxymuconolactone decarboxylase
MHRPVVWNVFLAGAAVPAQLLCMALLIAGAPAHAAQTSRGAMNNTGAAEFIELGSGPLLVLVVDEGGTARNGSTGLSGLAQGGFHVLLLRSSGTVESTASRVTALIERLGSGPALLVGEGAGASIVRRAAADRPDLVRGLVLVSEPALPAGAAAAVVPPAAILSVVGETQSDISVATRLQADAGSRHTLLKVAGAAPWREQPAATTATIVNWLKGPSLSGSASARIAAPPDAQLTAEQRGLRQQMQGSLNTPAGQRVGVLGPREVLINDPRLLQGYTSMGDVMATAPVPLRYKEMAILMTARALDSSYEWYAHEKPALNAGVPATVVAAIRRGQTPTFERADDRIVYNYVDQIHRQHRVDDDTYHRAWDLLGTNGLLNLTMVVGHYMGVATTLNVHAFALPAGVEPLPSR